jgi:hypothetical protein
MVLGSSVGELEQETEDQTGDQESIIPETPKVEVGGQGLHTLRTSQLLQMILQDAQTRLVFKAQSIIQSDIRLHVPTDDDLNYPEKIIGEGGHTEGSIADYRLEYRKLASNNPVNDPKDDGSNVLQLRVPSPEVQKTWYPSVRKAIWIISLLQDLVKVGLIRAHYHLTELFSSLQSFEILSRKPVLSVANLWKLHLNVLLRNRNHLQA